MTKIRTLALALAGAAAVAAPTAASAQERCLTSADSRAVVSHLLPNIVGAVGQRCARFAAADQYIAQNGNSLSARLQPTATANWAPARAALERMSGSRLPDNDAILNVGRAAIANGIANGMDAGACDTVSKLTRELAPLPPQNFANVMALFLELGARADTKSPLKFCPTA